MPVIEGEIVIAKPVREVFDFAADASNEPRYNPKLTGADKLTQGRIRPGTRFQLRSRAMGRPIETLYEVTQLQRPRRMASHTLQAPFGMEIEGASTFQPVQGGTRLRWRTQIRTRGASRLLMPLLVRMLSRRLDTAFANMKELMESREGSCRTPAEPGKAMRRSVLGGPAKQGAVVGVAASVGLYLRFFRPWQLRWGATDEEVARPMPGDEIVQRPSFNATRAVTVHASSEEIWPWLVQMGCRRGGWYSYDLLDNLGRPSAEQIIPELQQMEPGDLVPMSPDGKQGIRVRNLQPYEWMLWASDDGNTTWCWGLYPVGEFATRLVTRIRMRYDWTSPAILFGLLVEFADILMMRKCLFGIKRRAEALASTGERSAQTLFLSDQAEGAARDHALARMGE
ncbi:MAG: SRPBCC family protein [Chloroflexota bacterium]|nr:SRPBCC family protein [Chloroflexota bacterium]